MAQKLIISTELSPQHQLRHFANFRWGLIAFTSIAAIAGWLLDYQVSSWPLIGLILLTHISTNLIPILFAGSEKQLVHIYTISCCLDILLLGCLLLLSGGVSNGLVALLLLPVAVAAVMLPGKVSYLIALLAIMAYSLLLLIGDLTIPDLDLLLQQAQHAQHNGHMHHLSSEAGKAFNQHMLQMWWAFTLSALLISWFVNSQANLIRLKSQQISALQQQQVRHEHMLALATFAANAAHDLASPIQTMSLLVAEISADNDNPALNDLCQQLNRCQQIVRQLRADAGSLRNNEQRLSVLALTEQQLQRWLNSRPDIDLVIKRSLHAADFTLPDSQGFGAALINILDNAADASLANNRAELSVSITLQLSHFSIGIRDFGEGLSDNRLAELGEMPQQSEQGLGIGQFLANVSIERLGGSVSRSSLDNGTLTLIAIPRPKAEQT
ncbi:sensor histidine kinase KdpD [Arsukibacterium sp. MJ3]|uniref:sensor histidine kinase n=1 Tax=Arsukibacterium sp. MJ3 TaxID=1632859 RepID=UPI000A9C762F|nr:ATP-binding protein [Arsukibacterium sp. MJ3]